MSYAKLVRSVNNHFSSLCLKFEQFVSFSLWNINIFYCIQQNVLHWHIIDEESFPLEVPTYPNLWKGAYTKWERYTMDDAYEIVTYVPVIFLSYCCLNKQFNCTKNKLFLLEYFPGMACIGLVIPIVPTSRTMDSENQNFSLLSSQ